MSGDSLSLESFGFSKEEIIILTSITYHGIVFEAEQSKSYSRMRRYFRSEEDNNAEQSAYQLKKREWAWDWMNITCKLLEINGVIDSATLPDSLKKLSLSEAKKNAMIVELSTFEPYFDLSNDQSGRDLRYDDADRSRYFRFCSTILGNSMSFPKAYSEFNDCAKKITKSIAGPNWTWAWIGLGAAVLLITAPYLAGAIGGVMGLGGAAATSAGLAFLGGGSLAAGGLGITGGYFALMAGGAILGYGAGSKDYKDRLKASSKEELLVSCSKLFAVTRISSTSNLNKLEICKRALAMQTDYEAEADGMFINAAQSEGQKTDAKALVLRAFRRVLRGEL
ncbi:hypothetical protein [Cyanobium sp. NIES-981]|uniref:hypothetical protein n=1 Tax=Cyanobium sp. NIES-981 TaxID=1851505 RepID=UPI0012F80496|nr:hypothetical protein [Cyanobium sp. NIES-981]